jgi:hypothetical protein
LHAVNEPVPAAGSKFGIRPAWGLLIAGVLLAELAARWAVPAVPTSAEARRNPYRFRGWPEYVAAAAVPEDAKRTVVLITNCQGYGGELPARMSYPAHLETLLNERAWGGVTNWQVLNWALDGATSIEYTILAAYLREHPPAAVLASLACADFRGEHFRAGYEYPRSDLSRLAVRPSVQAALPADFLRRHWKVEDAVAAWCTEHFALLRLKEYLWSWLEGVLPGSHYALYAPTMNYRPWRMRTPDPVLPELRPVGVPRDDELDLAYDERSRTMLEDLVATLAAGHAPVALIVQPFRDSHSYVRQFAADLEAVARRHELAYWDLRSVVPRTEFMTSNHLTRRGHRRLAAELADRLTAELSPKASGNR